MMAVTIRHCVVLQACPLPTLLLLKAHLILSLTFQACHLDGAVCDGRMGEAG